MKRFVNMSDINPMMYPPVSPTSLPFHSLPAFLMNPVSAPVIVSSDVQELSDSEKNFLTNNQFFISHSGWSRFNTDNNFRAMSIAFAKYYLAQSGHPTDIHRSFYTRIEPYLINIYIQYQKGNKHLDFSQHPKSLDIMYALDFLYPHDITGLVINALFMTNNPKLFAHLLLLSKELKCSLTCDLFTEVSLKPDPISLSYRLLALYKYDKALFNEVANKMEALTNPSEVIKALINQKGQPMLLNSHIAECCINSKHSYHKCHCKNSILSTALRIQRPSSSSNADSRVLFSAQGAPIYRENLNSSFDDIISSFLKHKLFAFEVDFHFSNSTNIYADVQIESNPSSSSSSRTLPASHEHIVFYMDKNDIKYIQYDPLSNEFKHHDLKLGNQDYQRRIKTVLQNAFELQKKPSATDISAISALIYAKQTIYHLALTPPPQDISPLEHQTLFLYYDQIDDKVIVRLAHNPDAKKHLTLSTEYVLTLNELEKSNLRHSINTHRYCLNTIYHHSILRSISQQLHINPTMAYGLNQKILSKISQLNQLNRLTLKKAMINLQKDHILTYPYLDFLEHTGSVSKKLSQKNILTFHSILRHVVAKHNKLIQDILVTQCKDNLVDLTALVQHLNHDELLDEKYTAFLIKNHNYHDRDWDAVTILTLLQRYDLLNIEAVDQIDATYPTQEQIKTLTEVMSSLNNAGLVANSWLSLFSENARYFIEHIYEFSPSYATIINQAGIWDALLNQIDPTNRASTIARVNQYIQDQITRYRLIFMPLDNIDDPDAQSTHTVNVHLSVTCSLNRLAARYHLSSEMINTEYQAFLAFKHNIHQYDQIDAVTQKTAMRCIDRLKNIPPLSKEKYTDLSLKQILALLWKAVQDTTAHVNGCQNAYESLICELRHIQREYNHHDDNEPDVPSCFGGTINGLVNALNGIHSDVVVILMTDTFITERMNIIFDQTFLTALQARPDQTDFIQCMMNEIEADQDHWNNSTIEQWYLETSAIAVNKVKLTFEQELQLARLEEKQLQSEKQRIENFIDNNQHFCTDDKRMLNRVNELLTAADNKRKRDETPSDDLEENEHQTKRQSNTSPY